MIKRLTHNPYIRGILPLTVVVLIFLLLIVTHLILSSESKAATGINKQLNYQGKLADTGGNPVTDGNYDFKFVIYDSLTGGAELDKIP